VKALILNSGLGSRMTGLETCKCLVELDGGTTVLDAQIESLLRCGVTDFYVTTGAYADLLETYINRREWPARFTLIHNPQFCETNYIYSIFLAREMIRGDVLLLHGDLVFEQNVLQDLIAADGSAMVIDSTKPLPDKDFRACVSGGKIARVGVGLMPDTGEEVFYAQPLYKLSAHDWDIWMDEISNFCNRGETGVYAENALNNVSGRMSILGLDVTGRACFEVDNPEDLAYGRKVFAAMSDRKQKVYTGQDIRLLAKNVLRDADSKKPFVVSGSFETQAREIFGENAVYFNKFTSNPVVDDVAAGVALFEKTGCDFIISFGGGSAIDTAKSIKKDIGQVCHLAIPTTAGTGSEATRFAVLYEAGEKQSIENDALLPEYVILNASYLQTLPLYHKKSAMLDALCQAIESIWSVNHTYESVAYALSAVRTIFDNVDAYLQDNGDAASALRILNASHLAGKAINITKTTAPHAMSYKLTTKFGLAHGHAVALCMMPVWRHLLECDAAPETLQQQFLDEFTDLLYKMNINAGFDGLDGIAESADVLAASVNAERLGNHPVKLSCEAIAEMYRLIDVTTGGTK